MNGEPKYETLAKRFEQNHQSLLKDTYDKGHLQVKIGGEIYDILQNGDQLKLQFLEKDPDSIFYLKID